MKSVTQKRILNFIIIVTMFISGMCFEYVEADSFFVYTANEIHSQTEVLTSAKETPVSQTICTNEIIGRQRIECREVQNRRNGDKSVVRGGIALSSLEVLPKAPIVTKSKMMKAADHEPSGKEVIIAYIHHQDGEKDFF